MHRTLIEKVSAGNFVDAIVNGNIRALRLFPKSDLHNHCLLGGKRTIVEAYTGKRITPFKSKGTGISSLNQWIVKEIRPLFNLPGTFEIGVEAAFMQAKKDGVTLLEMSIDALFGHMFNIPPEQIIAVLKESHHRVAPGIDFRPELGFSRSQPLAILLPFVESYLQTGYFRSIDLYDDEFAQPIGNFKELYRTAKKLGIKCKAHAGEFGTADSVVEAVEILELDAVQHGIGAADSPHAMKWLSDHNIQLNVCPTSNIRLKRVKSYKTHPLRILFDHGIRVTVNTDDALIFGDGVSEQFKKLYTSGLFNANELEIIRQNGLS